MQIGGRGILDEFPAGSSESGLQPANGAVDLRKAHRGLAVHPACRLPHTSKIVVKKRKVTRQGGVGGIPVEVIEVGVGRAKGNYGKRG